MTSSIHIVEIYGTVKKIKNALYVLDMKKSLKYIAKWRKMGKR